MEDVKAQGDEELYSKLDSTYSTEEEDTEVYQWNFAYFIYCSLLWSSISMQIFYFFFFWGGFLGGGGVCVARTGVCFFMV